MIIIIFYSIFQKKGILSLKVYKNLRFFFSFAFNDITLNAVGAKYKANGYTNPIIKLEIESVINILWVFSYTAQNAEIIYQKNKNNIKVKI